MRVVEYAIALMALAGLLCLFLLVPAHLDRAGMRPAATLERQVEALAEDAVASAGHSWVEGVEADGQTVILQGEPPSADAAAAARRDVLGAGGPGGMILGPVTAVRVQGEDRFQTQGSARGQAGPGEAAEADGPAPYRWTATKTGSGMLHLAGDVPNRAIRQDILSDAEAASAEVADKMTVQEGGPGGDWQGVARFGLEQLLKLNEGRAILEGTQLTVAGISMDEAARAEVSASVPNVLAPYEGVADIRGPGRWQAVMSGDVLRLTGRADSEAEREEIAGIAREYFRGQVVDEMTVSGEAMPRWTEGVRAGLPQFSRFESGSMVFDPERPESAYRFRGQASASTLAFLREDMGALDGPFGTDLSAEEREADLPELDGLDLAGGGAAACQSALDAVMAGNSILFETGSARIDRQSADALDKVVAVIRRCDRGARIAIEGHTDAQGDADANLRLSAERAAAVRRYLEGAGAAEGRLRERGLGASAPVASNDTAEGRAANRRIAFAVSSADAADTLSQPQPQPE